MHLEPSEASARRLFERDKRRHRAFSQVVPLPIPEVVTHLARVLVGDDRGVGSLHPNRVSIWPVEGGDFGIDFSYHGAIGYGTQSPRSDSSRRTRSAPASGRSSTAR